MTEQLGLLFLKPKADDNPLVLLLQSKCFESKWIPAAMLKAILRMTERGVRELAEMSNGRIISGQEGYCLIDHATPEEILHASSWLISQGKKMIKRGIAIRRRGHQMLQHENRP